MLENTEAFKSFEGTESFLKLLMKYNCAEPIGLKILLCFGHFKQLFDSKLHLWNIVKQWWKRLFCKMLKVKVTLMSLHRRELDNQYVLFQMTYIFRVYMARISENLLFFWNGKLKYFLEKSLFHYIFWNILTFWGDILPTVDQIYFCLNLKYKDTITVHNNKFF